MKVAAEFNEQIIFNNNWSGKKTQKLMKMQITFNV